jgi:hypothetical protein
MRLKQSGLAIDAMSAFRQGNARHMSKGEISTQQCGRLCSRLDTDVAAPASSGGQASTRKCAHNDSGR